jgi:hypothetical protein
VELRGILPQPVLSSAEGIQNDNVVAGWRLSVDLCACVPSVSVSLLALMEVSTMGGAQYQEVSCPRNIKNEAQGLDYPSSS